jgi:restriction endonuclease
MAYFLFFGFFWDQYRKIKAINLFFINNLGIYKNYLNKLGHKTAILAKTTCHNADYDYIYLRALLPNSPGGYSIFLFFY